MPPLGSKLLNNRVTRRIWRDLERQLVSRNWFLSRANERANGPDDRLREAQCLRSARNLYGARGHFAWRIWPVRDAGVAFNLPLRSDHFGFDWARALTILGHDIEVKQVYRQLVISGGEGRGRFIDIGANFGQHSQYFLAAGWGVLSFEPNPACLSYHREVCALNGWRHDNWHVTALGYERGRARLVFPEREEWLGRIELDRPGTETGVPKEQMLGVDTDVAPLSDFVPSLEGAVVKVDVEGFEAAVFQGLPDDVHLVRCVFFEANGDAELLSSVSFFKDRSLSVFALGNGTSVGTDGSQRGGSTNFVAVPASTPLWEWLSRRPPQASIY